MITPMTPPAGTAGVLDAASASGTPGRTRRVPDARRGAPTPTPPVVAAGDDQVRAGDRDREETEAVLRDAVGAGLLTVTEFEQRVGQVWAATRRAQLTPLTADLPAEWVAARAEGVRLERDRLRLRRRVVTGVGVHAAAVTVAVLVVVTVWAGVGLAAGLWLWWPIWPITGTLLGLATHVAISGAVLRARSDRWSCSLARGGSSSPVGRSPRR